MKRQENTVVVVTYSSDVLPEISSERETDEQIIAWGDANPVAWKIITAGRSAPFGRKSSTYIGWAQGKDSPAAVIERLATLRSMVLSEKDDFWRWRARFTMEHYGDRTLKGGMFLQFDGQYTRGCCALDYTPATLQEVIDRFLAWCDLSYRFPTREVRVDDRVVRRYDEAGKQIAGKTAEA